MRLGEPAEMLMADRDVLRVSIDGFHHPRAHRYARGTGADAFYADSYDYGVSRGAVLEPFRRGQPVVPALHDVDADRPIHPVPVGLDTVMLVDAPFTVTVPRGSARYPGHDNDPEAESNRRYVGGQQLYVEQASPRERATWVFDNTELDRPRLTQA